MRNLETLKEELQEVTEELQEGVEEEETMDQDGNHRLHQILGRKKEGRKVKRKKDLDTREKGEDHLRMMEAQLRPRPPQTLAVRLIS